MLWSSSRASSILTTRSPTLHSFTQPNCIEHQPHCRHMPVCQVLTLPPEEGHPLSLRSCLTVGLQSPSITQGAEQKLAMVPC